MKRTIIAAVIAVGLGYAATTDPVAVAGPCGVIYVALIAFNRNGNSAFAVAKLIDRDDTTGNDHTIRSTGEFSVIETGNNAQAPRRVAVAPVQGPFQSQNN